jgi:hypothetical protein
MLPPGLHSQQAGTMIPTLMPIPPATPPMNPLCSSREAQIARMIRNSISQSERFLAQADLKTGGSCRNS